MNVSTRQYLMRLIDKVPPFPNFRKFSFTDRKWYEEFYAKFPPYADFSFENLLVWCDIFDDLNISLLNNNIILTFTDPFGPKNESLYTILGDNEPIKTLKEVSSFLKDHTSSMLPDCFVDKINNKNQWRIIEDRDNWDYIYSLEKFTKMQGGDYSMLRKNMRRILRTIDNNFEFKDFDLNTTDNRIKLINLMHSWDLMFSLTDNDPLHIENKAIDRLLSMQDVLGHKCYLFYFKGQIEGFLIFHTVPQKDYIIFNHIKCSYKYRYMFDFIFLQSLAELINKGFKFVNMEQDLGSAGLRQHKLTLRPQMFLRKYKLSKP